MIGRQFGRLTVRCEYHIDTKQRKYYLCDCVCGTSKAVQGSLLRSGNTKSCGCLSADSRRSRRLPNDAGVINHIILQYKRHASDRSIVYALDRQDVDRLVRMPCHYCGIVGGNLKKTKNRREGFAHNGIDRIDSAQGYHLWNVVPCCGLCNRVKRDMPRAAFIAWAKRVAEWSTP